MTSILVVDDSPLLHAMFRHVLASMPDADVTYARHGVEALEHIARDGEPALVLLDINMPVMDGLEFLDELGRRGMRERVPVVIVSTEDKEADILRGLEAGARGYLRKPFSPDELLSIIRQVVDAS